MIQITKKEGETMGELTARFREENQIAESIPVTFTGRLDPLATGVVIYLVGDEVHEKDDYLNLDKEYVVEILFGVSTDTGDLLGIINNKKNNNLENINYKIIKNELLNFPKEIEMPYPIYSSRKVLGKPLWNWAREGRLNEIEIPKKKITIKNIKLISHEINLIDNKKLFEKINTKINNVKGDFRQEEIKNKWADFLIKKSIFYLIKIKVESSAGSYMRFIADEIGKRLGVDALAYSIERTRIVIQS